MAGTSVWTERALAVGRAIVTWIRQESAATQALVTAFLALGIAFQWWHWSEAETGAVIGITTALMGMFVRSQVTPLIRPRSSEQRLVPEHAARPAGPVTRPRPAAPAPAPAAPRGSGGGAPAAGRGSEPADPRAVPPTRGNPPTSSTPPPGSTRPIPPMPGDPPA